MEHNSILTTVIGAALTVINGLILIILSDIKTRQKDMKVSNEANIKEMWNRIYSHYHEIGCDNKDCTALKTGNVVIPHEGHR